MSELYRNKRGKGRMGRAGKPGLRVELNQFMGATYGAIEHGDTGEGAVEERMRTMWNNLTEEVEALGNAVILFW